MAIDIKTFKYPADSDAPPKYVYGLQPGHKMPFVEDLPDPISIDQFKDKRMFEKVKVVAEQIVRTDNILDARDLFRRLKNLREIKNEVWDFLDDYKQIRILMAYVSLHMRKEEEIIQLFKQNILLGLESGLDIKVKLETLFSVYDSLIDESTILPFKLTDALEKNLEVIGSEPILLAGATDPVRPFVKNWLRLYRQFSDTLTRPGKITRGSFERSSFAIKNEDVRKLKPEDRNILMRLFELYDWLRFGEKGEVVETKQLPKPVILTQQKGPPNTGLTIDKLKSELKQAPPVLSALEQKYIKPAPAVSVTSKPLLTPDEIKREVRTPELPAHDSRNAELVSASQKRDPEMNSGLRTTPAAVDDIKFVDDLKKIRVAHLRRGNLGLETEKIKAKIAYLAAVNRLFPHEVVAVFEQSPLFKLYLKIGGMLIADRNPDRRAAFEGVTAKLKLEKQETLTLPEFESVADLKKEIERM